MKTSMESQKDELVSIIERISEMEVDLITLNDVYIKIILKC